MRAYHLLTAPLVAAAMACGSSNPTADHGQLKVVAVGSEFTLRRGERASVDDGRLLITFLAVASDSRCPADVVCGWQGDAAMLFRLESAVAESPTIVDTIHTELQPRSLTHQGYTMTVKTLEPYPYSDQDPGSRDYRATLIVTQAGG